MAADDNSADDIGSTEAVNASTSATTASTAPIRPSTAPPNGDLIGVLATAAEPLGAVLVIHENRGLTPHIRTIPVRLRQCRSTDRGLNKPDFSGSPNAAVLGIYAELDTRVNASQDKMRTALATAGLTSEIRVFPGVDHAFFNETGPRYNAAQAAALGV